MVSLLKPGETVIKAIKRFGNSNKLSISNSNTSLSASQRWCKKNKSTDKIDKVDSEEIDKESLEKLTGYANHFIDRGFYDIYEETFEKLTHKINNFKSKKDTLYDIFSNEADNISASTSGNSKNYIEGKGF